METSNKVFKNRHVRFKIYLNEYKEIFEDYLQSDKLKYDLARGVFITTESPSINDCYIIHSTIRIARVSCISRGHDDEYDVHGFTCMDLDNTVEELYEKYSAYPCMIGTNDEVHRLISFVIR